MIMATLPAFEESFSALIAAPSVSSADPLHDQSNRPIADLLANWFADLGFKVEMLAVNDAPEKVNVIASLGQGDGGLVLSGHTDTVPFTASDWRQDPFKLTHKDGRYYGLGTSDMKCFFPIVMEALQSLDLKKVRQPIVLLATCDEESTMAGARALADANNNLGRHALIGEPTGLTPVNMHKGVMLESITLKGQAGHASDPALGNNAMEGMHGVISALMKWRDALQKRHVNNNFEVPVPTMNFGTIHGGDNPNRICAECELRVDLRVLPGMNDHAIRQGLRDAATRAVAGSGLQLEFDGLFPGVPPMATDANSEIVKVVEALTGQSSATVSFATEGPLLNAMGMNTVVLGPGDIEQAHQANEYIEQARIQPMQAILKRLITHFCM